MPRRRYDLSRAGIGPGVAAIKREAGVRDCFPPAVLRAARAARDGASRERVELPFAGATVEVKPLSSDPAAPKVSFAVC